MKRAIRLLAVVMTLALGMSALLPVASLAQLAFIEPYSVRSAAMGESGSADLADPGNVFFNPAVLAGFEGVRTGLTYSNPLAFLSDDVSFVSVGLSSGHRYPLEGDIAFSLGVDLRVSRFDFGDVIVTDVNGRVVSVVEPTERAFGISGAVGLHIGDKFFLAIGGSVKPLKIEQSVFAIPDLAADPILPDGDGTAFDVGFFIGGRSQGEWSVSPSLGVSLVNLGSDIEFDPQTIGNVTIQQGVNLPEAFRLGAGIRIEGPPSPIVTDALRAEVPEVSLAFNAEFLDFKDDDDSVVSGGVEVGLYQILFVRAGFIDDEPIDSRVTWGVGLGLPYDMLRFRFDYGRFAPFEGRDAINRFGGSLAYVF